MKRHPTDWRFLTLLLVAVVLSWFTADHVEDVAWNIRKREYQTYDYQFRALPHLKPDPRIVIIGMDDESLSRLPIPQLKYPLPRTYHAELIDALNEAGAKVIGLDITFAADRGDEDVQLAAAMARHKKVVAALPSTVALQEQDEAFKFSEPALKLRPFVIPGSVWVKKHLEVVRSFQPFPVDSASTKRYLHFSVALAAAYFGDEVGNPLQRDRFTLGQISAPVDNRGEILIRFAGPPGTFKPVPYSEVLDGSWKLRYGEGCFQDKVVLVGRISPVEDRQNTPLGSMQGVEILANATQAMLQGRYITPLNAIRSGIIDWYQIALTVMCVIAAIAIWRLGLVRGLLLAGVLGVAWELACRYAFIRQGLWIKDVEPMVALGLTCVAAASLEARRFSQLVYRLMPAQFANQMIRNATGGTQTREQDVTVVFCDIRNYTTLSELLPSATLEQILRTFFSEAEEAANRLGADVDKFVGDEIMVFFEPRRWREPHELRAVRWAITVQETARRIDESGIPGHTGFRVGAGISSGKVRIGAVPTRRRIQHTVIGDAVNIASRLQTMTKELNRPVVISEMTYLRIQDKLEAELISEVNVRGKKDPIKVYAPGKIGGTNGAKTRRK